MVLVGHPPHPPHPPPPAHSWSASLSAVVFALARLIASSIGSGRLPLLSLHQGKPPTKQFTRKRVSYQPGLAEDQQVAHPVWTPSSQSSTRPFAVGKQQIYKNREHGALERYVNPDMPIRHR